MPGTSMPPTFGLDLSEPGLDSPKKSLVDKSSPASTPGSDDSAEVTRPLTAEHHETSSTPLIPAEQITPSKDKDSHKGSQEDTDEKNKKIAAKILTSTPQKNGKMKGDAVNGHEGNERLKIGDETVLTIVGDNDATDGSNGSAEEKLKLTENIDGEPTNGHSKNGGSVVNGSPKKKSAAGAATGGRKFKVPEWLWKPKGEDERRPPGEGSARGMSREKRRLYMVEGHTRIV